MVKKAMQHHDTAPAGKQSRHTKELMQSLAKQLESLDDAHNVTRKKRSSVTSLGNTARDRIFGGPADFHGTHSEYIGNGGGAAR